MNGGLTDEGLLRALYKFSHMLERNKLISWIYQEELIEICIRILVYTLIQMLEYTSLVLNNGYTGNIYFYYFLQQYLKSNFRGE